MFKPCGHRIIVRRDPAEETTSGGIIIATTESAKKLEAAQCQTGVIVAVGPNAWEAFRLLDGNGKEKNGKPWATVGDYVLFAKYAGRNVIDPATPDEEDLIILNDEDVISVITDEPTEIPACPAKEAIEEKN